MINFKQKEDQIPEEFKKIAKDFSEKGFITTSSDNLIKLHNMFKINFSTTSKPLS